MNSEYQVWKDIDERFKFFLLLMALCGCGWLAWHKFIYVVLLLIFGGIAAAMIPLYETSQERLSELSSLDESDLQESIITIRKALSVIEKFRSEYPEIESIFSQSDVELESNLENELVKTGRVYSEAKHEREKEEYRQKQIARKREESLVKQRAIKGVKHGSPPNRYKRCPPDYPIIVTENLPASDPWRGIYYSPGDPDYESGAEWCFKCIKDAETDGYRLSLKPYYQKKYGHRRYR